MTNGGAPHGQLETAAVVLAWFVLNIAMGSTTKWIFLYGEICVESSRTPKECHTFKFPLTITVIHMVFSWGMCWIQLYHIRGRPKGAGLSLGQQMEKVVPLSICFSLSVAMGNLSLKYIYPSFNQMLGAMSPLITVAMAVVMQRKRYNWWTWMSMPVICGGLALCSAEEVNFNVLGTVYATGATVLRALKSIMQGRLLQGGDKMDSVTLLFYMAPWAAAFLGILATATEGIEPQLQLLRGLGIIGISSLGGAGANAGAAPASVSGGLNVLMLLVVSGLNACLLNVANFMVTSYTSPVTLQVLGNVKSCLAIGVSVAIFRNSLTLHQGIGVIACLFGVWLYNQKGGPSSASAPERRDQMPRGGQASKGQTPETGGFELVPPSFPSAVLASRAAGGVDRAAAKALPGSSPHPRSP